ncbi:thermonuclease family protein [Chelatococcus sp. SYSU_G07232]|uniref:Thermonuclease family protein n=1 Tax=Chelatococcus albus TaxID=3047466 RepID=A0ABT7ADF2_9HYPH|nr:thermonuclease family protein [Chelatococcus sp. SYSU_G07232]MDJ1157410.1 thermonuclease family protein [Chelatococcus sp. SYSU_G07232]
MPGAGDRGRRRWSLWALPLAFLPWLASVAAADCLPPLGDGALPQRARVARVAADRSLVLDDGRLLRLADLDLPEGSEAGVALETRLAAIVNRSIAFRPLGPAPDRWGRILAQVVVGMDTVSDGGVADARGAARRWLEDALVAAGLARVRPEGAAGSCARLLLAREDAARRAGLGLWQEARYAVRSTADPAALEALAGSFALVEGVAASVGERKDRTYVNFGQRWSVDTTVTISKRNWRRMRDNGISAARLKGRRVRVRGFVEADRGPLIEVSLPEEIEFIEADRSQ